MTWIWDNLVLRPFKWMWFRVTGAPFDGTVSVEDDSDDDGPRPTVTL